MFSVGISTDQALKQLNLLTLSPNKKRRILRGAGRKVRRDSKARVTKQQGLNGKAWQGRANGKKNKMLKKIATKLIVKTSTNNAEISFNNARTAKIARAHQQGDSYQGTPKQLAKKYGEPDENAMATRNQAKALRSEGYKIRKQKGKGWKNPTLKWITENLSMNQAGAILRFLRAGEKKDKWQIKLPERSFLGQDKNESKELKNYMLNEATRLAA